ncbi:MAG: hypothetical protein FMNOHCHN_02050 [Ignavibacteriaceae bacterium]|nr:hypothetical protein [Ignavibacteriaceae bacterium]
MILTKVLNNYSNAQKRIERSFVEDFSQLILALKPDAKTFEFEGYSEYNDEGGSNMYFSSLTIDNEDLEEIVSQLSKDKLKEIFALKLNNEDFEDKEYVWDRVRDEMYGLPEFVYNEGKIKIKCATV